MWWESPHHWSAAGRQGGGRARWAKDGPDCTSLWGCSCRGLVGNGQGMDQHQGWCGGTCCRPAHQEVKQLLDSWRKPHDGRTRYSRGNFPTSNSFWKGPRPWPKKSTGSRAHWAASPWGQKGCCTTGRLRRAGVEMEARVSHSPAIAQQVHRDKAGQDSDRSPERWSGSALWPGADMAQHSLDRDSGPQKQLWCDRGGPR